MAIKDEHLQKVQGNKKHVLYKGLLAEAHERWGKDWSMEVEWLGFVDGRAMCSATIITPEGQRFIDIGDADAQNTNKMIALHLPRMAATRAKGRALRDALNISETMFEELGPDVMPEPHDSPHPERSQQPSNRSAARSQPTPQDAPPPPEEPAGSTNNESEPPQSNATERQVKMIEELCNFLKSEAQTREEAVAALEDSVGYPISLMSEHEAGEMIAKLNKVKAKRVRERG